MAHLRPTRQRIALAELLFAGPHRHISAEELHQEAADANVNVSLATIYNTLHQFRQAGLLREADRRPLVVLCDDAYSGLVFESGVPNHSFFWDLAGAHENLVPVKVDGATKEFGFFGGRVGFFTLGIDLPEAASKALENKIQCVVRATIGSPVATSQMILMQCLKSGQALEQVQAIRDLARVRYDGVQSVLGELDPDLLRPLPFNAGFFVLMQLAPGLGLDPHTVRKHLIEHFDTGIVASQPDYLRVAICSVAAESVGEIVLRVEKAVRQLASKA